MNEKLYNHARKIYSTSISENMPNEAVKRALNDLELGSGRLVLISIGKAGWEMAKTAYEILGDKIDGGVVITKYDHTPKECKMQSAKSKMETLPPSTSLTPPSTDGGIGAKGQSPQSEEIENSECEIDSAPVCYLGNVEVYEAGHPVVDINGLQATKRALEITENLAENDTVLFLVSGGGSALFESVDCGLEKMQDLTKKLLECGATINEINAIRKHISNVKGGKLAKHIYPARVFAVVLSDVVGNDLSTIASGPACADTTTVEDCLEILNRYSVDVEKDTVELIKRETPKEITNATHIVSGSVTELCRVAREVAQSLGYQGVIVDDGVTCDAKEISEKIRALADSAHGLKCPTAYIFGGEVTIKVRGKGKGGRNQELALMCAEHIRGKDNMAVFCVGSDGTDGPTDAAGGYVDGDTYDQILKMGKSPEECLKNNDSYPALQCANGLIFTGPTGTNVNDIYILLVDA